MATKPESYRLTSHSASVLVFHKKNDTYFSLGSKNAAGIEGLLQPEQVVSKADIEALTDTNRRAFDALVADRTIDMRAA